MATKLIVDERCQCLQKNNCAKYSPLNLNDNLYKKSTDKNGKPIFNNDEQTKMKKSLELFNKIVELKSQGKGKSEEVKSLYVQLDKLNYDVRKSMLTLHAEVLAPSKAKYKANLEEQKKKNEKLREKIADYLKNGSIRTPILVSKQPETTAPTKTLETKKAVKEARKEESTAKVEKEEILKNINPEKLKREEDDSLFDIVTKTYKRTAYPVLLGD